MRAPVFRCADVETLHYFVDVERPEMAFEIAGSKRYDGRKL